MDSARYWVGVIAIAFVLRLHQARVFSNWILLGYPELSPADPDARLVTFWLCV